MKTFNYQFRKTFEIIFHGEIEAKSEKEAQKKIRKFAEKCHPDNEPEDGVAHHDSVSLDNGDDFMVWSEND